MDGAVTVTDGTLAIDDESAIASPLMDPEIFSLSVAMLGWPLACAQLSATLILSLGAGFVTLALTRSGWLGHVVLRA